MIDNYVNLTNQDYVTIITKYNRSILTNLKLPDDCIGLIGSYLTKNISYNKCITYIDNLIYQNINVNDDIILSFIAFKFIDNYFFNLKYEFSHYINEPDKPVNFIYETFKYNIEQTEYMKYFINFINNNISNNLNSINNKCVEDLYSNYSNYETRSDKKNKIYENILNGIYDTNFIDSLFFIITVGNDIKKIFFNNNCDIIYLPYYELLLTYITNINSLNLNLTSSRVNFTDGLQLCVSVKYCDIDIKIDLIFVLNCILLCNAEIINNSNIKQLFVSLLSQNISYNNSSNYYKKEKGIVQELFSYSEHYNQELLSVLFQNRSFVNFFKKEISIGLLYCTPKYIIKYAKKYQHIFLQFDFIENIIKKRNIKLFKILFKNHGLYLSKLKNEENQNLLQITIKERGLVQNFVKIMLNSNFFTNNKIKKYDVKNKRVKELFTL